MGNFHSDDFGKRRGVTVQAKPRYDRKPLGTLILSGLFFVPLAPLAGMLGGMSMRSTSLLGRIAIGVGLLCTLMQGFAGYRGYQFFNEVASAPGVVIAAGYSGDTEAFTSAFTQPPSAEEAALFIGELRTRYGTFHVDRVESVIGTQGIGAGILSAPRAYELLFDLVSVQAEATYAFHTAPGLDYMTSRIESLTIHDEENGDLTFPPRSRTASAFGEGIH